jgi:tetratricopeptide (TPR) repeat protein
MEIISYAVYAMTGVVICLLALLTWVQTGYWKDSIILFEHVLTLNPNNEPAHGDLGAALLDEGDTKRALFHLKEALRLNPDSANTYFDMGIAYFYQKDYSNALLCLHKVIEINPNDIDSYIFLGNILVAMGKSDEAAKYFNDARKLTPINP